jgi:glycosyltransferase involved in cell wall biosynthesis
MSTPLVSIIIPTYNGANRIFGAIRSVVSQTYTNWELFVIDDGSTDNTGVIVSNFIKNDIRIKYVKNDVNLGIQKTLNKGLRGATGEYIARIDDDDIWIDEKKLEKQVEFLEKNNDYVLVGTGAIVVDEQKEELFRYLVPSLDQEIRNKILLKNCFVHSSVMFRKETVVKMGGYDESSSTLHVEDYDLWLRLGTVGKFENLPIYATIFSLREGSLSSVNKIDQFRKNINLIKLYKNKYPRYFLAYIFNHLRLLSFNIFKYSLSNKSKNKLIKIYKEN